MTNAIDITDTLRNVRYAYRFLHEFQIRLRDTIERFRQEFDGFIYSFSGPIYTDKPSFRKSPHDDKWTIDLFPAHTYSMRYEKQSNDERSGLVEVLFHCDTEFEAEEDRFPLETESSKSTLEVYFWVTDDPIIDIFKWQSIWNQTGDYPEFGEVKKYQELGISVLGMELDFAKLTDENGIQKEADRIKAEIKKHLQYSFDT